MSSLLHSDFSSWGIWALSSPTRDGTEVPALGAWSLIHRTPREVPVCGASRGIYL